jgi:hypothetical protein
MSTKEDRSPSDTGGLSRQLLIVTNVRQETIVQPFPKSPNTSLRPGATAADRAPTKKPTTTPTHTQPSPEELNAHPVPTPLTIGTAHLTGEGHCRTRPWAAS